MVVTREKARVTRGPVASAAPPLSERVKRLREAVLSSPIEITSQRSHIVTEYYKRSDGEPTVLRRARALKEVLENIPIAIWDDELIVGNLTNRRRGCLFYPEYSYRWLLRELGSVSTREIQQRHLPEEDKQVILNDIPYWVGRSVEEREKGLWQEQLGDKIDNAIEGRR